MTICSRCGGTGHHGACDRCGGSGFFPDHAPSSRRAPPKTLVDVSWDEIPSRASAKDPLYDIPVPDIPAKRKSAKQGPFEEALAKYRRLLRERRRANNLAAPKPKSAKPKSAKPQPNPCRPTGPLTIVTKGKDKRGAKRAAPKPERTPAPRVSKQEGPSAIAVAFERATKLDGSRNWSGLRDVPWGQFGSYPSFDPPEDVDE